MDIRNHYTLTKPYYFFHFKTSNLKLHRRCGEGPVGMLEEVGRHEGRSTVGCLHPTTSTLPVGDAMDYVSDNFGETPRTLSVGASQIRTVLLYIPASSATSARGITRISYVLCQVQPMQKKTNTRKHTRGLSAVPAPSSCQSRYFM